MPIYISYHPIDGRFAVDLAAHLKNDGFNLILATSNCSDETLKFSNSDVIIAILRPAYIKLPFYKIVSEQSTNLNIIPILRAPIALDDWNEMRVFSPIADFTGYSASQMSLNLGVLDDALTQYREILHIKEVSIVEAHLNLLQAALKQRHYVSDLLECLNHSSRPLAQNPIFTMLEEAPFKISLRGLEGLITGNYRTDQLKNVAHYQESYVLTCGDWDSQIIVDCIVNTVISSGRNKIIPILLNLEIWNNEVSWSNWLVGQINVIEAICTLEDKKPALYVYGFEHSPLKPHQFRERFNAWWHHDRPTLSIVLICNQLDEPEWGVKNEIIIERANYDLRCLEILCSKYSDRPIAQFLLSSIENTENFPQLAYLANNPIFTASILSLHFEANENFHQVSIKNYFERFLNNIWEVGDSKNKADFPQIKDGLLKIASILTERRKSFMLYTEALNFIDSEAALNTCIEVGLFNLIGNQIYFSMPLIQDYFAATALVKYGVPDQLPRLALTTQSNRILQRWDSAVIIASHISPVPDEFIRKIADIDPVLALQCVNSGIPYSSSVYSYVTDKNLDALVSIGDFRIALAKLLYGLDPVAAKAILVEVLRKARWSLRLYAYTTLQGLGIPSLPGLVESLSNISDHTRSKVSQAIRRIGSNAIPTLFQLLHHDNVTIRLNAIWAISELKDKAYVPALVKMLWDHNVDIVIQAATTLGVLLDVDSVPYLAAHLKQRHIRIRKAIANSLLEIQSKCPDEFTAAIQQIDAAARRLVVVYLSTTKTSNLYDFLLAFSYDENPDVKIAALEGLATIAEPRVISRLEECLEDMSKSKLSQSSVSEIVSRLLSTLPRHEEKPLKSSQIVKARLLNAKEQQASDAPSNPDEHSGSLEVEAGKDVLPMNDSEDVYVSDVLSQLRTRKWDTSNNAAKMLRDHIKNLRGNTSLKVINQILETLNDPDWVIRWTGVETLGWVGNIHVVPHLIQRLEDVNWKVRVAAIRALAEIKDDAAIAGLSICVSDSNSVVREAAAEALGYLDGKQAINALETAVSDSEDFVRLAAVESLGKTHNKLAAHSLLTALKDSSEHVRWAAANSLFEIADASLVPLLIPSLSDTAGPYWEQKRICDVIVDILKQVGTEEAKLALLEWQNN